MTSIISDLERVWSGSTEPFFVRGSATLSFAEVAAVKGPDLGEVSKGDVVALIGDFNADSVNTLLKLIELGAIVVPLTEETKNQHDFFLKTAHVDFVIRSGKVSRAGKPETHPLIQTLRAEGNPGLILFSSGTTGEPKAILHDLKHFLQRYSTPRPSMRTLGFLLFDHIGGINTLLHTLYNRGVVVIPELRSPLAVLEACDRHEVEVLPATPTFLRMLLLSGLVPNEIPKSLKVITYGTEKMDQTTLSELCGLLPDVDFRQTYGMSELGILRVKSESRESLFMRIGGEGVDLKVVEETLFIRSSSRMLGYLNAESPFDEEGWYNTKDLVQTKGDFYSIVGRASDVINFGGLKFMPAEVENAALAFPGVILAKAFGRKNPFSGEHAELVVQVAQESFAGIENLKLFLETRLQGHMMPKRISLDDVAVGHRFKKL
jgi:long-chain acyl-CoA synthetase